MAPIRAVLLAIISMLMLQGCGGGVVFFSVRFGTVASVNCTSTGGSFDLHEATGLTVLVVLTDQTDIVFVGGGAASCRDITPNASVRVRGDENGGTIRAQSVQLQR